ncbi:MAG: malonyl-CoA decarboxylase family protein [bacterium]|nr:malonyl-CoA decarboxylase family protein [bacterium]
MVDTPEESASRPVFNRLTRGDLKRAWYGLKNIARLTFGVPNGSALRDEKRGNIKEAIAECIYAKGGDASARSRTLELGTIYLNLSKEGRDVFHHILAHDFDTDREEVAARFRAWEAAEIPGARIEAEIHLKDALIPPRTLLLKKFSSLPSGLKFLIDMRAELLPKTKDDPLLYKLSLDIREILSAWFDVGLLDLREITWDSPAALLEKLIEYEAVHKIDSWTDLRKRLSSDRLCFAFFHNKMPTEPLIFVEVALVDRLSSNITELLHKEDASPEGGKMTTAIFYSITNTQPGLIGIHLGDFLIKKVVEKLSVEGSSLKRFATLSPVPGFRKWLDPILKNGERTLLTESEQDAIRARFPCDNSSTQLYEILAGPWRQEPETAALVKPILLRLCGRYLLQERRGERAMDPVAHFHLNNGARLERINWLADESRNGMERAYGMMVNYNYRLADIEKNHEAYATKGKAAAAREISALAKKRQ